MLAFISHELSLARHLDLLLGLDWRQINANNLGVGVFVGKIATGITG